MPETEKKMKYSSKILGGVDPGGKKDSVANYRKQIIAPKVSTEKSLKMPTLSSPPKFSSVKPLILRDSNIRKRIFKKKGVDGDKSNTIPISRKIVLRHQDVQEKKDVQGLLNNVIEEMASKLVETGKSKVKALVGAFEIVISLHNKPSAVTVS
ncbi:hypothetical protein P3S68_016938 [Capsicum galapagoense]